MSKHDSHIDNIENSEIKKVISVARTASKKAVRESTALGLVIKIIEGGNIVKIYPDGTRVAQRLRRTSKKAVDLSSLQKGDELTPKK